jgi:hypothetical protein
MGGHCPLPPAYVPPAAATTKRRLAADTDTTMHYDYIMENLDGQLAEKLDSAVDTLGKDETVATNFVSNLITLPAMTSAGLSPIQYSTLKSEKRAVVPVPDEMVEQADVERCDSSETCYVKQPKSEGKSCSNIASIYLSEKSFDMGTKASNVPAVCGNLCTESFDAGEGCRAFEIRNAPDEVVYCLLFKDACKLGAANELIRAQYYLAPDQPGFSGFKPKQIAGGAAGAFFLAGVGYYMMSKRRKPFGGKAVKRGGYSPMTASQA